MNILWGLILIVVGLFLLISGTTKSNFIIYRLFVARSKILWGKNVHQFYQVVGVIITVFGILLAIEAI